MVTTTALLDDEDQVSAKDGEKDSKPDFLVEAGAISKNAAAKKSERTACAHKCENKQACKHGAVFRGMDENNEYLSQLSRPRFSFIFTFSSLLQSGLGQ